MTFVKIFGLKLRYDGASFMRKMHDVKCVLLTASDYLLLSTFKSVLHLLLNTFKVSLPTAEISI